MLTDEQIDQAFEGMTDGPSGFLKSWGYRHFAKAIEAAIRAELAEDAERYKFAVSPGAGGSMNWLDVYEAWNGDGDFTAAIDAARAAKGGE